MPFRKIFVLDFSHVQETVTFAARPSRSGRGWLGRLRDIRWAALSASRSLPVGSFGKYISFAINTHFSPSAISGQLDPHEQRACSKSSGAKVVLDSTPIAGTRMDTGESRKVGFYNRSMKGD